MENFNLQLQVERAKNQLEELKANLQNLQSQVLLTEHQIQVKRGEIMKLQRLQNNSSGPNRNKCSDVKEMLLSKLQEFRVGNKKMKLSSREKDIGPEVCWIGNVEVRRIPLEDTFASLDVPNTNHCTASASSNSNQTEQHHYSLSSMDTPKEAKSNFLKYNIVEMEESSDDNWKSDENMASPAISFSEKSFSHTFADAHGFEHQSPNLSNGIDPETWGDDNDSAKGDREGKSIHKVENGENSLFFIDTERGESIETGDDLKINFNSSPVHEDEYDNWETKLQQYENSGIKIVNEDVEVADTAPVVKTRISALSKSTKEAFSLLKEKPLADGNHLNGKKSQIIPKNQGAGLQERFDPVLQNILSSLDKAKEISPAEIATPVVSDVTSPKQSLEIPSAETTSLSILDSNNETRAASNVDLAAKAASLKSLLLIGRNSLSEKVVSPILENSKSEISDASEPKAADVNLKERILKSKLLANSSDKIDPLANSANFKNEIENQDSHLADKETLLKALLLKRKLSKRSTSESPIIEKHQLSNEINFNCLSSNIPEPNRMNLNNCTMCGQFSTVTGYPIGLQKNFTIPICQMCSLFINSRAILAVVPGCNTVRRNRLKTLLLDPANCALLEDCLNEYFPTGNFTEKKAAFEKTLENV
ncbi:hypothetical protein HDV06_005381 [Boothiomyces sp. JEL0866]|nr:hypothetical protein HDV06_005381 [Boothiomyces sp. JEL0866]